MRIAIYGRVSKSDDSQDPQNQLVPLRDLSRALGADEVIEYVDLASGGNGERQEFLKMLDDADHRRFDLLLVWALDRISREGISTTLGYLERLKKSGVGVRSLKEPWMDTSSGEVGQLLLAIFAWVARQERHRIIERTKAGLERAKREGKVLGRPKGVKDGRPRARSGYWLRYKKTTSKREGLNERV